MASGCARGDLGWTLGKILHGRCSQALEEAVQGSGGVTIPRGVQKVCERGTWGHGLAAGLALLG